MASPLSCMTAVCPPPPPAVSPPPTATPPPTAVSPPPAERWRLASYHSGAPFGQGPTACWTQPATVSTWTQGKSDSWAICCPKRLEIVGRQRGTPYTLPPSCYCVMHAEILTAWRCHRALLKHSGDQGSSLQQHSGVYFVVIKNTTSMAPNTKAAS